MAIPSRSISATTFRRCHSLSCRSKPFVLAKSWKKVQQRDFQKLPFEPCELCSLVPVSPKSCNVATAVQSIGPEKKRKLMRTNTMRRKRRLFESRIRVPTSVSEVASQEQIVTSVCGCGTCQYFSVFGFEYAFVGLSNHPYVHTPSAPTRKSFSAR